MDWAHLKDSMRFRRGNDASPLLSVGFHRPALICLQALCLSLAIHWPNGFGRFVKGRVLRVNLNHGQDGGERVFDGKQIAELLLDHVSNHPLCLSPQNIQRVRLDFLVRRRLQGQEAYLWSIAVADDELVACCYWCQCLGCNAYILSLVLRSHRLPTP